MAKRPKTNLIAGGQNDCIDDTVKKCELVGVMFGEGTGTSVQYSVNEGEVLRITGYNIPDGNSVKFFFIDAGTGLDCADCDTKELTPYAPCCEFTQKEINSVKSTEFVVGPAVFRFVSDSPAGSINVKYRKLSLDNMPEGFLCAECEPPCLPVAITTASTGETSATVTIVSGSDAYRREVTVKLFNGENEYEQVGINGDVLAFTGLQPNTTYSVVAENDCGEKDSKQVTTSACPAVSITMATAGTNAVTVTVNSGGSAWVEVGDAKQYVANGATATFSGLAPDTEYFATATSDCGSFTTSSAKTLPCPAVVLTQTANTPNSVTISSNIAAIVTLGSQEAVISAGGSHTFTELKELTNYTVKAATECGAKTVFTAVTAACPAIILTQTANTTSSITVTLVTGGGASVFVGADEVVLANSASHTFLGLTAGKTYTAKVVSECGNKASFQIATAACPTVDFTATALSTTSLQVTAIAGTPLDVSIVSQGGAVLDSIDGLTSTIVFTDLPEGAIVTVKAVNECGKKKQLNVNLPDPVANPCPSFSLTDASPKFKGFAFVDGDLIDPAATVAYRGGFIYPAAGLGHTVKVTDNLGAVIGYAVNKSECANPCCTPISNRTNVNGDIIDDSTNNYYVQGEVNKCDGSPVLPADRLFNKGSLKTCVNGELVDLDCGMIVKTIDSCCEPTVYVGDSGSGGSYGICAILAPTGYDVIGRMAFQSRDASIILGNANILGGAPAYFQKTYTNPSNCKAYLRIDAQVFANYVTDQAISDSKAVFVHTIGEELNIVPPSFGGGTLPVRQNWAWTPIYQDTPNASVLPTDPAFPLGVSSQASNTLVFEKILNPNETITLYGQWWAVLYNNGQTLDSLHGGMYISEKLFLNAGEF